MSMQPMYRNTRYTKTRAYDFSRRGLYLPTFTGISNAEMRRVANAVHAFFHE
jgi:dTDP-4-amino-4,6-dideoxygalactose transaminase